MNNDQLPTPSPEAEHYRSLQILNELANNDSLTQRDLSSKLGIALGLVNSYIKNLAKKGFITIKAIPPKRYAYYLTPKGFTEKTRLTYHMLSDYTRIYREARENLKRLFHELQAQGVKKIVFAGADEVAEIAYLSLQETNMTLAGIVDDDKSGQLFFGREIQPISMLDKVNYDRLVITSYLKQESIQKELEQRGIDKAAILIWLS